MRSPALQAPGKRCGEEQLRKETPRASRGICRGAVQLTGEKHGFVLQVGGSKARDCKARVDVSGRSRKCL